MEMTIIMLDIKEIKTMTLARIDQYFFPWKRLAAFQTQIHAKIRYDEFNILSAISVLISSIAFKTILKSMLTAK
ncbi:MULTISPECIES: hypothetical protein [Shewanella]|nr:MULTISPECIES: hypothetical protein [Shewanella]